jgi:hypothetical protein
MSELYNVEEDPKEDKPFTWSDEHTLGKKQIRMTKQGTNRFSNNMGHGAECPTCSQGMLEDQEADLSRDEHFRNAMSMHMGDNNG